MVKDVLLDVVDCSGIDLGALHMALEEFVGNPPLLDGESLLGRDPSSHLQICSEWCTKSVVDDEWRSLALCRQVRWSKGLVKWPGN
jgi:hypothetical protein